MGVIHIAVDVVTRSTRAVFFYSDYILIRAVLCGGCPRVVRRVPARGRAWCPRVMRRVEDLRGSTVQRVWITAVWVVAAALGRQRLWTEPEKCVSGRASATADLANDVPASFQLREATLHCASM
jgi:hypothetical protein